MYTRLYCILDCTVCCAVCPSCPQETEYLTDAELWVMSDQLRELESIQLHIVQCDDIQVKGRESGSSRHTALHALSLDHFALLPPPSLLSLSLSLPSLPPGGDDGHQLWPTAATRHPLLPSRPGQESGSSWRREGGLGGQAAPLPRVPPRGKDGSGTD